MIAYACSPDLALLERRGAQVLAVELEQVERPHERLLLTRASPQQVERSDALRNSHDRLAVDQERARRQSGRGRSDCRIARRPVVAIARSRSCSSAPRSASRSTTTWLAMGRRCLPRHAHGAWGHRVEAAELALPVGPHLALAQGEEPGESGGATRGVRRLGQEAQVSESAVLRKRAFASEHAHFRPAKSISIKDAKRRRGDRVRKVGWLFFVLRRLGVAGFAPVGFQRLTEGRKNLLLMSPPVDADLAEPVKKFSPATR